jgi:hypothetical protein
MIAPGHRFGLARLAVAAFALTLVAGCTGGETTYESNAARADALREARQQLIADLRSCSERYDYNPNDPNLPENGLAPHEQEWRQCAYDAARNYTRVNTPLALDFATLIDEDQKMTEELAAGQITRSERRERLQVLIEAVHDKELAQLEALEADPAREQDLVRQVTEGLRGLN